MPTASSFGELESMLRTHLRKAMEVVKSKAEADMFEETGSFYTVGHPTIYQRTGGLGSSPRTTNLSVGNVVSFEAYLDPNQGWYGQGNPNPAFITRGYPSYFSPMQILNAAEYHFAGVKGRSRFWFRAEKKMEQDFHNTISSFFN